MIFMVFMIASPLICFIFGLRYEKMKGTFRQMLMALIEEIDLDSFIAKQYYTLMMLRRIGFTLIAIYFVEYGQFQVMIYFAMSYFNLMYLVLAWPLDSNRCNLFEVFNEITILTCGYSLFLMTDFVEKEETKWNAGWFLVALTAFNILVTLCFVVYDLLGQIGDYIAEKCYKKGKGKKRKKVKETQVVPFDEKELDEKFEGKKMQRKKKDFNDTRMSSISLMNNTSNPTIPTHPNYRKDTSTSMKSPMLKLDEIAKEENKEANF